MVQFGVESENGWRPAKAGPDILQWVTVPGTTVTLRLMKGPPLVILRAYAADYNAYVEPLRDADSAAFTATNSVATSNHLNATAMDLNWNSHPFKVSNAGYTPQMIATMREMEAFYTYKGVRMVFWAQDWNSPKDAMHHQMGYGTWNNPVVDEFIRERIRPDGFSTFRRGAGTPSVPGLTVEKLAQAMGNRAGVDYTRMLTPYRAACDLIEASGNLNRLAMFAAQIGHESGGLQYMEEIASGAAYEGRADLGNTQPGDGVRFKGRGPIQITGRHNYTQLSKWAFEKKLVPSATFFVDQPAQLADPKYGFLGAVWYWMIARPKINQMCDAADLEGVTRAINGGLNGLADRRTRWDRCRAMGLAALDIPGGPTQGEDALSAEAERMIRELYDEYKSSRRAPTRSFFGENQDWGETPLGFLWNIDGNMNELFITFAYLFGVDSAVDAVNQIAANGVAPESWAGNEQWLAEFGQQWCQGLIQFKEAINSALIGDSS